MPDPPMPWPDPWVCASSRRTGPERTTPESLSRQFTKPSTAAGLRRIRLHDTRHTAASLMPVAGEAPKVVAELLGHSSPSITMNFYQHLMPGMGEAAAQRLTGLLSGDPVPRALPN
jgi:integrase